jgi:uncharacterized OsmC-like protein
MTGVLAGALEARQIPSHPDKLYCDVEGVMEKVDGKVLLTSIQIRYRLVVPRGKRSEAERALEVHEQNCPAALSVRRGVEIQYTWEIKED